MKRNKLAVGRERLRNLTFGEMRKAAGGFLAMDDGGGGGGGGGGGEGGGLDGCESGCADNTLSHTITHDRSYQNVNTIC